MEGDLFQCGDPAGVWTADQTSGYGSDRGGVSGSWHDVYCDPAIIRQSVLFPAGSGVDNVWKKETSSWIKHGLYIYCGAQMKRYTAVSPMTCRNGWKPIAVEKAPNIPVAEDHWNWCIRKNVTPIPRP